MECFYGRGSINTDKTSDEYISVNNFGYYKNIDQGFSVKREKGRLDYQIIYIDKGYGYFWLNDNFVKVTAGNFVILFPGEKNHYEFTSDSLTDYYWIHFTGRGVAEILNKLKLEDNVFEVGDFFEFKEAISAMSKSCVGEDFTTESYLSSCIYTLLAKTSRKIYIQDTPIRKILVKMQSESIKTFNNSTYAKMCGLSDYHFIRVFKKITGRTPHQYMAKITVNKAIDLLSTTNLNVSETARLLGFDDSLYFSRFFKKETGLSPKKYFNKGILK